MEKELLRKINKICGVPISVYMEQELLFEYPEYTKLAVGGQTEMFRFLEKHTCEKRVPVIITEDVNILFGAIRDDKNHLIILGPVSRKPVTEAMRLAYAHKHRLGREFSLKRMEINALAETLSLLMQMETGEEISTEMIQIATVSESITQWNTIAEEEHYKLEQSESEWDHNSLEYENRLTQIVRDGDIEAMNKLILGVETLDFEHVGKVAENDVKQAEYLVVTLFVMISRAAVEGGMNQEKAYGLADIYLRKLEKAKSVTDMYALASRAEYEFTELVKKAKEEKSNVLIVEQCKQYIAKNLRKPIQVGDIAPVIGINRCYLARRFSQVEGITIQKYIMRERCAHAANMLKFSDYTIALIAEYFCFSSQSHFGKNFKEFYDMTPNEYRNMHKKNVTF